MSPKFFLKRSWFCMYGPTGSQYNSVYFSIYTEANLEPRTKIKQKHCGIFVSGSWFQVGFSVIQYNSAFILNYGWLQLLLQVYITFTPHAYVNAFTGAAMISSNTKLYQNQDVKKKAFCGMLVLGSWFQVGFSIIQYISVFVLIFCLRLLIQEYITCIPHTYVNAFTGAAMISSNNKLYHLLTLQCRSTCRAKLLCQTTARCSSFDRCMLILKTSGMVSFYI